MVLNSPYSENPEQLRKDLEQIESVASSGGRLLQAGTAKLGGIIQKNPRESGLVAAGLLGGVALSNSNALLTGGALGVGGFLTHQILQRKLKRGFSNGLLDLANFTSYPYLSSRSKPRSDKARGLTEKKIVEQGLIDTPENLQDTFRAARKKKGREIALQLERNNNVNPEKTNQQVLDTSISTLRNKKLRTLRNHISNIEKYENAQSIINNNSLLDDPFVPGKEQQKALDYIRTNNENYRKSRAYVQTNAADLDKLHDAYIGMDSLRKGAIPATYNSTIPVPRLGINPQVDLNNPETNINTHSQNIIGKKYILDDIEANVVGTSGYNPTLRYVPDIDAIYDTTNNTATARAAERVKKIKEDVEKINAIKLGKPILESHNIEINQPLPPLSVEPELPAKPTPISMPETSVPTSIPIEPTQSTETLPPKKQKPKNNSSTPIGRSMYNASRDSDTDILIARINAEKEIAKAQAQERAARAQAEIQERAARLQAEKQEAIARLQADRDIKIAKLPPPPHPPLPPAPVIPPAPPTINTQIAKVLTPKNIGIGAAGLLTVGGGLLGGKLYLDYKAQQDRNRRDVDLERLYKD